MARRENLPRAVIELIRKEAQAAGTDHDRAVKALAFLAVSTKKLRAQAARRVTVPRIRAP
jgi:hypothetical protein